MRIILVTVFVVALTGCGKFGSDGEGWVIYGKSVEKTQPGWTHQAHSSGGIALDLPPNWELLDEGSRESGLKMIEGVKAVYPDLDPRNIETLIVPVSFMSAYNLGKEDLQLGMLQSLTVTISALPKDLKLEDLRNAQYFEVQAKSLKYAGDIEVPMGLALHFTNAINIPHLGTGELIPATSHLFFFGRSGYIWSLTFNCLDASNLRAMETATQILKSITVTKPNQEALALWFKERNTRMNAAATKIKKEQDAATQLENEARAQQLKEEDDMRQRAAQEEAARVEEARKAAEANAPPPVENGSGDQTGGG